MSMSKLHPGVCREEKVFEITKELEDSALTELPDIA